jgi:excisionase family DNA binding protein
MHTLISSAVSSTAVGLDGAVTLTINQACQYTGLSRSFLYKLFDSGTLKRLKAGKRALVFKKDLDLYLLSLWEASE